MGQSDPDDDEYWGASKEQWNADERASWDTLLGDPGALAHDLAGQSDGAADDRWSVTEQEIAELRDAQAEARGPDYRPTGARELDRALDNLDGQAVNWMSEVEVQGHGIPVDIAVWDALDRDALGPWLARVEADWSTQETDDGYRYQTQPDSSYFQADVAADGS